MAAGRNPISELMKHLYEDSNLLLDLDTIESRTDSNLYDSIYDQDFISSNYNFFRRIFTTESRSSSNNAHNTKQVDMVE